MITQVHSEDSAGFFPCEQKRRALRRYGLPFSVSGTLQGRMSHAVNRPDRPLERDFGPKLEGSGKLAWIISQSPFKKGDMNKCLHLNCWQKYFLPYICCCTSRGNAPCQGELDHGCWCYRLDLGGCPAQAGLSYGCEGGDFSAELEIQWH